MHETEQCGFFNVFVCILFPVFNDNFHCMKTNNIKAQLSCMAVSVIENVQTRESNSAVHSTQKKRTNLMAIFTYRGGGVPHLNSISFIRTMMFYSSQPDAFSLFTFNAAN